MQGQGKKVPNDSTTLIHSQASWTNDWLQFDNSYYQLLLKPNDKDLSLLGTLLSILLRPLSSLLVDTDQALVQDPDFKRYVEIYAANLGAFSADYSEVSLLETVSLSLRF